MAKFRGFGNGQDGDYSIGQDVAQPQYIKFHTYDSDVSYVTGTAGQYVCTPGNLNIANVGDMIVICQMQKGDVGGYEVNQVTGKTPTQFNLKWPLDRDYTHDYYGSGDGNGHPIYYGAQVVKMKQYANLTVGTAGYFYTNRYRWISFTSPSNYDEEVDDNTQPVMGLMAIMVSDTLTLAGGGQIMPRLRQNGYGYKGGGNFNGGYGGKGGAINRCARGIGISDRLQNDTGGGGGGGAGGSNYGNGGGGSFATVGDVGTGSNLGDNGSTYGDAACDKIYLGAGGGMSWGDTSFTGGGSGGGIVLIFAKRLTCQYGSYPSIVADGDGTTNGQTHYQGGAGSGGTIKIYSQTCGLNTNQLSAKGGSTYQTIYGTYAGKGGGGRIAVYYTTKTGSIAAANYGSLSYNQVTFTPQLTTTSVTPIGFTSATMNANISAVGYDGEIATDYGVCYAKHSTPTTADSVVSLGEKSTTGDYSATPTLNSGTLYYMRPYATNSAGTTYGAEQQVATQGSIMAIM